MKLVTLFTDASYCPQNKVGGWAAWAKFEGVARTVSGALKGFPVNSHEAEAMAMVNGLHCVIGWWGGQANWVMVQSDCTVAMQEIGKGRQWPTVTQAWERLRVGSGMRVVFRHVKAHRKGVDRRSWVNEWCDKHAKEHMRARRQAIRDAMAGFQAAAAPQESLITPVLCACTPVSAE